jgi:hypothetical protein
VDRRAAVAQGVRHEIGENALECVRVDGRLQVGRHLDVDLAHTLAGAQRNDLLDPRSNGNPLRLDRDRMRVEPREVEELLDECLEPRRLRPQHLLEVIALPAGERVSAPLDRLDDPMDHGDGRAQLVRGEGDEVHLQLVGFLQRPARGLLLAEEPRPIERELRQRAERPQRRKLLGAEEGRMPAGPDRERAVRERELEHLVLSVVFRLL